MHVRKTGLQVKNGKVSQIVQMDMNEKKWEFTGNDSQIHMEFENLTSTIRLEYGIGAGSFTESLAVLYYKGEKEEFSPERTCEVQIKTMTSKTKDVFFPYPIRSIRFDFTDFSGNCEVEYLKFQAIESNEESCLQGNFPTGKDSQNIVIITHDLSLSGAPLLAFHMASHLHNKGSNVVVIAGNENGGPLTARYNKSGIPLVSLKEPEYNQFSFIRANAKGHMQSPTQQEFAGVMLRALRNVGYSLVITNTIVSGEYVTLLKEYNFKTISLIHEMKTTIEMYGFKSYGENIARFSDYIVFPNEIVKDDFAVLFEEIKGTCVIRPQGIYLQKEIVVQVPEPLKAEGIVEGDLVVMSSGMCELRKGVDLFINAATILQQKMGQQKIHFVWTGDFCDKNLEGWLNSQIERSGMKEQVHFISFVKDVETYKHILRRANCFWAMSREDPFPSTVLEAMQNRIPVVGFRNTGGIQLMLSEERGKLANNFDVSEVAMMTKLLLDNVNSAKNMIDRAERFVRQLDFDAYIDFLIQCGKKEMQVEPALDVYKWGQERHYYTCQRQPQSLKEKEQQLKKAIKQKLFEKNEIKKEEIVLLDTAIGSDNVGDEIIMDYCTRICKRVFPEKQFSNVPTHIYQEAAECVQDRVKILCGTNLIYKQMEHSRQWALPKNISNYQNICLLGVGLQQLGSEQAMSKYSKRLLKYMLCTNYVHSVRDEETKQCLEEIGIKNVLNTGCPTMWNLTPEHCLNIPDKKGKHVLTTITDYMIDHENDLYMLQELKQHYEKVYIWIQGQMDYKYLKEIIDVGEYILIPPSLKELDKVLEQKDIDYIGTRLHAGIRSINSGRRSWIVGVDNRARAIAKDTNLPVIEREHLKVELKTKIYESNKCQITLPTSAIEQWKNQF